MRNFGFKRVSVLLTIIILWWPVGLAQTPSNRLIGSDRAQIVAQSLRFAFEPTGQEKTYVVMEEEIPQQNEIVPLDKYLTIKQEEAITRINTKKGFAFIRLGKIQKVGNTVKVLVDYKSGSSQGQSGYTKSLEFKKIKGTWKGKIIWGVGYCSASSISEVQPGPNVIADEPLPPNIKKPGNEI